MTGGWRILSSSIKSGHANVMSVFTLSVEEIQFKHLNVEIEKLRIGVSRWGYNINYGDCCEIRHSYLDPAQVSFVLCLKQDQSPTGFYQ